MVRQFDARQYVALTLYAVRGYVALTQHIAVRGYVTLTSGARGVFIFFDCLLFFVLVPNCPRLAGRLCRGLAIDLE